MWWRRAALGLVLSASACGPGATQRAAPPPAQAATEVPAVPPAELTPILAVDGDRLLLDGAPVGSIAELESAPGYQLVEALDVALDAHASTAREPSDRPHTLRIRLPDELGQQTAVSAMLTAAAAGFDHLVAERSAGELHFRLFRAPEDGASGPSLRVLWLRMSKDAVHLTRWPEVDEQKLPAATAGPRHAALRAALSRECQTQDASCYDVAIVTPWGSTKAGELLDVVEALNEGRGDAVNRPALTIDFGGAAAGPERDPAAMHQTLLDGRRLYYQCYRTGLEKNPKLAGRIMVRFMVDRDGSVAAAHAADAGTDSGPGKPAVPPLADPAVTKCVESAFRTLKFEAAGLSTGNYPIVFSRP